MYGLKIRIKNIPEQVAGIRSRYPNFQVSFNHLSLKAVGPLQPTARSCTYKVEVKYSLENKPEILVLDPKLTTNFRGDKIPHVYSGNKLCLYRPKYHEFTFTQNISETIIPWITLWLYYYEVWHNTGDWLGGGEHPET
jgi:hypothetical protein